MFNDEHDIGTYTIKAVDDPRTLNKVVYIKPPKNIYSFNELVALWEKKIGKSLEKEYIPEELLLKQIQGELAIDIYIYISRLLICGNYSYICIYVMNPSWHCRVANSGEHNSGNQSLHLREGRPDLLQHRALLWG